MMIRLNYKRVLPICLALHMVACATPPEMPKLTMEVPNAFKESRDWVSATPSDALPRGAWWTLYHQPDLDQLEEQLNAHNNTLAVATAHYKQAEAYAQQLRSALYPSVDLNGGVFNGKQSNSKPLRSSSTPTYYNDFLGGVQINYEVDLWGRVHNMVNSGKQTQEAERATLASVQLSLQAELAQTYFQLRGIDTQIDLTQKSIETYKKSLSLIQNRLENGIATGLDLSRANTILEQTRGQLERLRSQRALAEHAIGALIGSNVSDFSLPVAMMQTALPEIPVGVPSTLLQRRPDIAAAERNVEVANASLGVAKTAYFPNLTLTSLVGYEGKSPGTFLSAPALFWAIGPALATNIFDGGKRKSQIAQAKANLEQSVASYRSAVITAFQQVEDNLSTIDHLSKATSSEQLATEAADKALTISINRYQLGGASYLEVTTSQITALQAKRDLITDQTNIMVASVQLIRALGGGWQTTADQTNTAMNMQSKP